MKHGQGHQHAILVAHTHGGDPTQARPADGLVRVHNAFGEACGARGIHDEQVVVVARVYLGLGAGGFAQQVVQVGVAALALANLYPGFYSHGVLIVCFNTRGQFSAFRTVKQGFGAAVRENERQFTGCEPRIQWHHDDAQFRRPVEQCHELHAVLHEQGNPVSWL